MNRLKSVMTPGVAFGDYHVHEGFTEEVLECFTPTQWCVLGIETSKGVNKNICDLAVILRSSKMLLPKTVTMAQFQRLSFQTAIARATPKSMQHIRDTGLGIIEEERAVLLEVIKSNSLPHKFGKTCLEGGQVIFCQDSVFVGEKSIAVTIAVLEEEGAFKDLKEGYGARRERVLKLMAEDLEIHPQKLFPVWHKYFHLDMGFTVTPNGCILMDDSETTLRVLTDNACSRDLIETSQIQAKIWARQEKEEIERLRKEGFTVFPVAGVLEKEETFGRRKLVSNHLNGVFLDSCFVSFATTGKSSDCLFFQSHFAETFKKICPAVTPRFVKDRGGCLQRNGGFRCQVLKMPLGISLGKFSASCFVRERGRLAAFLSIKDLIAFATISRKNWKAYQPYCSKSSVKSQIVFSNIKLGAVV